MPTSSPDTAVILENEALVVGILPRGSVLQDVRLSGDALPLVLGARDPAAYCTEPMAHFGAVMGPVANRIAGARGQIDGSTVTMEANQDGRHALHSGAAGLHRKTWQIEAQTHRSITLRIDCPDGEGGLPGNRVIRSRYRLEGNALVHELTADTDAPTWINLAHHGYWTMQDPMEWAGQRLTIAAAHYLPVDDDTIPTGEIAKVAGTPFDFRAGTVLDATVLPKLDHNFCLGDAPGPLRFAARLEGASRTLEIHTTAPGLQVFDMHKFGIEEKTTHGHPYPARAALAFEPQMWPDAPGRDAWPTIVTRPGNPFRQTTEYRLRGTASDRPAD